MADESNKHAWAAGFMDGEGCFTLSRHAHASHAMYRCPRVQAAQTTKAPLIVLQELYGGVISITRALPSGKNAYQWRALRTGVVPAIDKLLPYLVVKREEAVIVKEFALLPSCRGSGYSDNDIEMRRALIDRLEAERAA